jgi:alkanesulfonate monooxygenase SsuD/methylene tetrahydromethanopterin reductase-like flavin-dependent oxidoreductase (luciferase family)
MLRITMPHVQQWNAWYWWFGNSPARIAEQWELVDAACQDVGRDPSEIERTVAAYVELPGAQGKRDFDRDTAPPISGEPEEIAAVLRDFAAAGISHVQLVIDPVTPAGVEALAPILEALDASSPASRLGDP